MGSLLVIWRYVQGRLEHHIVREAHMSPCKKGWSRFGRMIWSKSPLENEIAAHHLTLCWRFSLFENRSNSFSAVWAARIAIQASPITARRTVRGSSEKMQPREDVRGKNENAEFCSRLPTKCGDGFRGFQSFCKVQTFFGLRPAIFRLLKTRDFRGICTPDCF